MFSAYTSTDMIYLDYNNKEVMVEVEYKLSNIFQHKHPIGTFDYIVCWEVDIKENPNIQFTNNTNSIIYKNNEEWFLKCYNDKHFPIIELKNVVKSILEMYEEASVVV